MMELERYNQSFEEHIGIIEEEADNKLRGFRQQCIRNLIENISKRKTEWEATFRDLLCKSQEIDVQAQSKLFEDTESLQRTLNLRFGIVEDKNKGPPPKDQLHPITEESETTLKPEIIENNNVVIDNNNYIANKSDSQQTPVTTKVENDPFPQELSDYFTNSVLVKEFVQLHRQLDANRQEFVEINTNPAFKSFKNEINLFVRTQINSISNSDTEHLSTKTRMLSSLFLGQQVGFQERIIQASRHPKGQLYAMDLAAQTFVTVGTRLVNSVPAIAKSMATVINDVTFNNNLLQFKDFILGNLRERCPYLVPMYPKRGDFDQSQPDHEVRYKVTCGYSYDSKTQALESEDKYLARMRSMVLIYGCILAQQLNKDQAWTWLVSFLSLKPEPVITASVLQAYLQETSKPLSQAFGRQYKKLLDFIKTEYVPMIERSTPSASERQSLIKLKNLLADDSSLIATPAMSSLFGAVRF